MSEQAGEAEQRVSRQSRIDMLSAMGITSWLPRKALPGAPAGHSWRARQSPAAAAMESTGPALSRKVQPATAAQVVEEARRLVKETSRRPAAAPVQEPAAPGGVTAAQQQADPAALRLELHQLRPGLALLVQWPPGGAAASERLFVADLVYALGVIPETLPAPLVLDWQVRGDTSGALRDAVAGFLAALSGGQLLALGVDDRACLKQNLPAGFTLLELPAVPRMIAEPGRKADVWKRLAHFLATDAGNA